MSNTGPQRSKHAPYLTSHRNALIFRIRIPQDVQACLGRTEYRRSLGRCYAVEAKIRALRLATTAFEVFSLTRAVIRARENDFQKFPHLSLNTPQKTQLSTTISKSSKFQRSPQTLECQGLELGCTKELRDRFKKESDTGSATNHCVPRAGMPQTLEYQGLELTPTKEQRKHFGQNPASVSTNHQTSKGKSNMYQENLGNPDVSTLPPDPPPTFQGRPLSSLTDDDLRSIADAWLLNALTANNLFILQSEHQQAINDAARLTLDNGTIITPATITPPTEHLQNEQAEARAETCRSIKGVYQRELRNLQVSQPTARMVDAQLAAHGITVADLETESQAAIAARPSKASRAYLKACHEFLKARVSFYDVMAQSAAGDYSAHDATIEKLEEAQEKRREGRRIKDTTHNASAGASEEITTNAVQTKNDVLKLSEALKLFFAENAREGKWSVRTQAKSGHFFELFQAIIDPSDVLLVAKVSADHIRTYKETLLNMPPMWETAYKSLPLSEVISKARVGDIPEDKKLSPKTISNHFVQIKRFINWLAENEYHGNARISGLLKPPADTAVHEKRNPYNRSDLTKIFAPADFLNAGLARRQEQGKKKNPYAATHDSGGKPSRFWVPLLGLFTGARIEELCQLHLTDIVAVNREGESRSLFIPGAERPAVVTDAATLLQQMEDQQETPCIFIKPGKGQSTKTAGSTRFVPLSAILIKEFDFFGYLTSALKNYRQDNPDSGRVFPELKKNTASATFSNPISQWYRRYCRDVGIIATGASTAGNSNEGGKKVFHSFRHTVAHWCDQIGNISEKSAGRYLGHTHGTITYGTYSTDTAPHLLYEQITAPFTEYVRPLLDIDGLKQSKWAKAAAQ